MLIPVLVEATVFQFGTTFTYNVSVGLSLNEPLPEDFPQEKTIINDIALSTTVWRGKTTQNVDAGVGQHYVIAGIKVKPHIGLPLYAHTGKISITIANKTYTASYDIIQPVKFVYAIFEVRKDGSVSVISGGEIAPGSSPITTTGTAKNLGYGDIGETIGIVMGTMLQMMVPIMMINMMIQMMTGMLSMVGGIVA